MTHSKTETRTPQKKRGRKAQRALERPAAKPQHDTQARQSEGVQEPKSQNIAPEKVRAMEKNHKTLKLILKPAVRYSLP